MAYRKRNSPRRAAGGKRRRAAPKKARRTSRKPATPAVTVKVVQQAPQGFQVPKGYKLRGGK